jgi:lipid-A-disaccharide synthase-like uncharacterized protein
MAPILFFFAVTVIGKEHRHFGLDWSWLDILGFLGSATFSMRFITQWLASEKKGESVIPVSFWYWSIAGSALMTIYFISIRNPVGIVSYAPNTFIYLRNLKLIQKKKLAATAAAESQTPKEED